MPPKRPSVESPSGNVSSSSNKQHKSESLGPDDFSNSVKRKLASSTRTGQACDRCKASCSPCLQNNTECRTTDRITGRATSRGYVEGLEQRANDMESRVRELEARLLSMGADVKPMEYGSDTNAAPMLDWSSAGQTAGPQFWGNPGPSNNNAMAPYESPGASTPRTQETNIFRALPIFRTGCNGDNYLGVSSGNSHLSSIKGTALSVLGMEIDIADFQSSDMDEPSPSLFQSEIYNKSYQSYLQSAFNVNPKIEKVDLPPKNEGLTYAQWYFRVLAPYVPVLHKPSFMILLTRIYDEPDFQPTPAETVMVHMMFATMFFQYATRNWENAEQQQELNTQSNLHYHYALGFYYQLSASHTLQDIQALTMICSHLRNFPKPGASWMVTNSVLTLAIELGLHRSAKRWLQQTPQKNALEIEMRKRIFWCLLANHVVLSGKLGRPMPLRLEDFDVELPEPVDDEYLDEAGIDLSKLGKCSFRIGIESFKLMPLYIELFNTLYAPKRHPPSYIENVKRLEVKLKQWRDQWPTELIQESSENEQEGRVFSLYLHSWEFEFRMLLRHPSVSLTSSPEFNSDSLSICVEQARSMLHVVQQLQRYKSLDTTWYNGSIYLMAITILLYGQWQRRDGMTAADLSNLRDEMDQWLDIMGDIGGLLGSGDRLKQAVQTVTDGTLGLLSRELATSAAAQMRSNAPNRSPSRSPGKGPSGPGGPGSNTDGYGNSNFGSSFHDSSRPNGNGGSGMNGSARNNGYLSPDPGLGNTQTPYPTSATAGQYSYPEPSASSNLVYPPQANVFASNAAYPNPDGSLPSNALSNASSAPGTAAHQQHQNPQQQHSQSPNANFNLFAATAANNPHNNAAATVPAQPSWNPGSQSWRQWTGTMAGNLEPQDCYSASALMQLGGRNDLSSAGGDTSHSAATAPIADMTAGTGLDASAVHVQQQQAPWPLMIFDIGQGGSS
ncbi:MAG: hypothetical protein M4579_002031 [Chaenotheca gracillima]|nr:MAG: hypothetical protein M4579_002031 [Chaenotheca gracillima]